MMLLDKSSVERVSRYIIYPDAADLAPSGDFTLEFFDVIFDSLPVSPSTATLFSHYNSTTPFANNRSLLIDWFNGAVRFLLSTGGTSGTTTTISYTWTPTLATAYNLAFERSGSTCRIYQGASGGNLSMVASGTVAGALFNCTDVAILGAAKSGSTITTDSIFTGSCKAFRFTDGAARYNTASSYTPPSLPLPTS